MLKFPYGISDFYQVITEDYFYVDRTGHIRAIEKAGKQLLFLRPRRFGKSLLLSTLENYYDLARAEEFERLFGHLAIGQDPTPGHNQYFILKWDFSVVDPQGEAQQVKRALHRYVNTRIQDFAVYYRQFLPREIQINPLDALASFQSLLTALRQTPHHLYLLIDEYDNFANEIVMGSEHISQDRYKALLYGEGSLKALFKAVKAASTGLGLERVFITGVSPVVLSDVTSGYNVAENIYLHAAFNDLCGFWESEVAHALRQIAPQKADEALALMHTFYNGYCFSYDADGYVYNPTLVLYFMKSLQRDGHYPREMLDSNLAMDREKIVYISRLPDGGQLILEALRAEPPLSIQRLAQRFGVEDMLHAQKDTPFMASLLYYFGILTLGGRTPLGKLALQIPNLVVQQLYVERIREMLLPELDQNEALRVAEVLYSKGDMQPLCDFVERRYFKALDNRDYLWANELTVKTAFLTLLFNDLFYVVDSETVLERSYADLTLILRPEVRRYELLDILIEFKYVKLSEVGLSGAQVRALSREDVCELPPVREKLHESRAKLRGYGAKLRARYGAALRLRAYSVVAVGFARLVWGQVVDD